MNGYGYRRYGGHRGRTYYPPPSPWAHLLGGIGQGVTQGVDVAMRKRERRRNMAAQVLESVVQGTDPMLYGTEEAGALFDQMGISKEKGIRELREKAIGRWSDRQPEMGPPAPFTMQNYTDIKRQEEEEKQREAQALGLQKKIDEKTIMNVVESDLARERAMRDLKAIQDEAEKSKRIIQDIHINTKTGTVTVDYLTPHEGKEELKKEEAARKKTYEGKKENLGKVEESARKFRLSGLTSLSAILSKQPVDYAGLFALILESSGFVNQKPRKELSEEEFEAMTPQERFEILRLEYNKIIGGYNKKMKSLSKELKLKDIEIPKLELIGKKLEDVEPPPPVTDEQKRGVIIPPSAKEEEETVDPMEVSPTEPKIQYTDGSIGVVRNGKWVKVKKK